MTKGVFTTIKVIDQTPLFFEQHKKRLLFHAKQVGLEKVSLTINDIKEYLEKNNISNCALKISVTEKQEKSAIIFESRELPIEEKIVKLITVKDTRNKDKEFKITNRVIHEKAKMLAQEQKANDAVFVQNNFFIESTIANIFSINKNGDIITPPLDKKGLKGIAREIIMKDLKILEQEIPADSIQPIVLINSLRIQMATHLNGKKLASPNKLFQKIKSALEKAESEYFSERGVARSEGFPNARSSLKSKTSLERARREGDRDRTPSNKKIIFKKLQTWIDPEEIFTKLFANKNSSFWLDSSITNETNRFSYMGDSPTEIYSYALKKNSITIQTTKKTKRITDDIFSFLKKKLNENIIEKKQLPFPFIGGFVGYFGYELKELTGAKHAFSSAYPDSLWFLVENLIAFDHQEKKSILSLSDGK